MYSNQIVPYNNPSLVGTPYIDQVSQYTAYMNAVCGFHDGYKRFQTVVKDNYDQTQLNLQYNALAQRPMMQMQQNPVHLQDIAWEAIPSSLKNVAQHFSIVSGWSEKCVLVAMLGYISSAMRGRYYVLIRPEWLEAIILYQLMIASPGQNKSLVHKQMNAPLEKFGSSGFSVGS